MGDRSCYLSVADLWALRQACEPLYRAYGQRAYLVGSCLTRRDYRDVDVRLLVEDDDFAVRYFGERGDEMWTLDCVSIGAMLRAATGLPIDFQPQARSEWTTEDGPRWPLMAITAYAGGPLNTLSTQKMLTYEMPPDARAYECNLPCAACEAWEERGGVKEADRG